MRQHGFGDVLLESSRQVGFWIFFSWEILFLHEIFGLQNAIYRSVNDKFGFGDKFGPRIWLRYIDNCPVNQKEGFYLLGQIVTIMRIIYIVLQYIAVSVGFTRKVQLEELDISLKQTQADLDGKFSKKMQEKQIKGIQEKICTYQLQIIFVLFVIQGSLQRFVLKL
eukprot:TRINITY_DN3938_c0_g2_i4.p2 TRINITY_DN3938_c0_g2~~TRINITY_DN3938_c0_g2_i4.p2  ORF type:complete len:166 (-),score=14.66 TRINITY_DN3938_c0_g2_i4:334-831(-)